MSDKILEWEDKPQTNKKTLHLIQTKILYFFFSFVSDTLSTMFSRFIIQIILDPVERVGLKIYVG